MADLHAMNPNDMAEDQLKEWVAQTSPDDVLTRVGEDQQLAGRVLEAEKSRGRQGRKDLKDALEKIESPPTDPAPTSGRTTKAEKVTPPGTVWLHGGTGVHHVEVGSPTYDALLSSGHSPGPAPKDAKPIDWDGS